MTRARTELVPIEELPQYSREAMLTVDEVAKVLRISTRQVERLDLPTVYLGRARRYIWGQVFEALASRAA